MSTVHAPRLSDQQKRDLLRDGFVIMRNAISPEMTQQATDLVHGNLLDPKYSNGRDPRTLALYNESVVADIVDEAMGPHTRPVSGFVATTMPGSSDAVSRVAIDRDRLHTPPAHVDGGWAGLCPMTRTEIRESGQTLHSWGSDGDPKSSGPAGGAPLWQDPDRTLAIGSFTAFVGVCLSDQTVPGSGQFAVRRGAHEAVEAFFQMQRANGGHLGGGGPLWPRLVPVGNDRATAGAMPEAMVGSYPETRFEADGWPWPELTPLFLEPGDAFMTLHALPHTATPNLGSDPRINVYFRIRRFRPENPHEGNRKVGWGVSDHPDRAFNLDFLDYPDDYDPYERSKDKLCDHWSEWDGMQDVVGRQREQAIDQLSARVAR